MATILAGFFAVLAIVLALEKPDGLEFADGFLAKGEPPNVLLDTIAHLLARNL